MSLEGRRALVLGGTDGVGLGIVEALAGAGASVVATGRRADAGAAAVARDPERISFRQMDVADLGEVRAAVDSVVDADGRLDVLVNNVGFAYAKSILDTTEDDFAHLVAVNLRYLFFSTQRAAEHMRAQGGGSIVNIGSLTGSKGYPDRAGYCAVKGGVLQLTKAAALDLAGFGIRVNCVSPGGIDTPLLRETRFAGVADPGAAVAAFGAAHPLGRIGRPSDIASAVLFLASDAAEWITGTNLVVDGGISAG